MRLSDSIQSEYTFSPKISQTAWNENYYTGRYIEAGSNIEPCMHHSTHPKGVDKFMICQIFPVRYSDWIKWPVPHNYYIGRLLSSLEIQPLKSYISLLCKLLHYRMIPAIWQHQFITLNSDRNKSCIKKRRFLDNQDKLYMQLMCQWFKFFPADRHLIDVQ